MFVLSYCCMTALPPPPPVLLARIITPERGEALQNDSPFMLNKSS